MRDIAKTLGVSVLVVTVEAALFYALVYTVHELPIPCVAEASAETPPPRVVEAPAVERGLEFDRRWTELAGCLMTHWEGTHYILHVCPTSDPPGWWFEITYVNKRVLFGAVVPFEYAKQSGLERLEKLATDPTREKR